jgi:signal transduction histidine kinase
MNLVEETTKNIRNVMADLRPVVLDDYGLVPALRWYTERLQARTGLIVKIKNGKELPRLPTNTESALFRIVQEALTNVVKHAEASEVHVTLGEEADTLQVVIDDNGRGFEANEVEGATEEKGWGIINMKERAIALGGKVEIESKPGRGTRISLELRR